MMLLWLFFAYTLAQTCVRDTYTSLPPHPGFPTATFTTTEPASSFVKNHWSEGVTLLRPPNTLVTTQQNCPHLQTGLVDWHTMTPKPTNGSNVTLPENAKVLVSRCSIPAGWIFKYITVPATSSLIFGDAPIAFQAHGMIVNGKLLAGSPTCRLRNKLSITLHGKRPTVVPALPYVKGIQVTGQIDLHAVEYFPTWTRLAKTAHIGNSTIFIQDCPNWQPGQSIVITTTELKDARDFNRNEVGVISSIKKVTSVSASTCAITLQAPIKYKHYGGFEYQAEVALLSRNFVFQGAADSEPTDTARSVCQSPNTRSTYACSDQYITGWGAHIMVMGSGAIAGRFSGIEGYRVGQTNALARYPFHWHMVGNISVPGSHFASDCSVHHSFFRCFTIHGTSGTNLATGVKLTKNVGYDVVGHCYFCSEDGMEENNTISYNLGAYIHILGPYWETSESVASSTYSTPNSNGAQSFGSQYTNWVSSNPQLILSDDIGASPFYFTNAHVEIFGNAASGGWAGFSFPNLKRPVGASAQHTWFVPKNRPLLLFKGNSAHSTGFWQSHASGVYLGGNLSLTPGFKQSGNVQQTGTFYTVGRDLPARDTCTDNRAGGFAFTGGCSSANRKWLRFEDTKVFLANAGLQAWGNREEIIRFEVHDVGLSTNVFGQVWIDQMLVNCRSAHVPTYLSGCNITGASYGSCNARDTAWFKSFNGFQFYDTGQSHLVTNSIFKNCKPGPRTCATHYPNTGCTGTPPSTTSKVWTYLTHSDQFTPGLMQQTRNISYVNVDPNSIMVSSTSERYVSVSGKSASWFDGDGTVLPSYGKKGKRVNIGSNWTNDWWKFGNQCVETNGNWVCEMLPGDAVASVMMHWNGVGEAQIGKTTCSNGARLPEPRVAPNYGYYPCPHGAQITHFGAKEGQASYNVSLMPRVTGPLIASRGGWFVRYFGGTPVNVNFTDMQIQHDDKMILAIPYPSSTTFNIYAKAPSYCKSTSVVCRHQLRKVTSVSAVRSAWGDTYYFDSAKSLLYVRVVELQSIANGHFGSIASYDASKPWTNTTTYNTYFARDKLKLLVTGNNQWALVIEASNCGAVKGKCILPTVAVPAALTAIPAPLNTRMEESQGTQEGSSNVGALVGGIVGGVVGLVLVGLLVAVFLSRKKDTNSERV